MTDLPKVKWRKFDTEEYAGESDLLNELYESCRPGGLVIMDSKIEVRKVRKSRRWWVQRKLMGNR